MKEFLCNVWAGFKFWCLKSDHQRLDTKVYKACEKFDSNIDASYSRHLAAAQKQAEKLDARMGRVECRAEYMLEAGCVEYDKKQQRGIKFRQDIMLSINELYDRLHASKAESREDNRVFQNEQQNLRDLIKDVKQQRRQNEELGI